jgi:hypothetical protein
VTNFLASEDESNKSTLYSLKKYKEIKPHKSFLPKYLRSLLLGLSINLKKGHCKVANKTTGPIKIRVILTG